ncbi:MAG: tRNA (adenosine(37)-N6)-threonylcarbamoyltransferase complex dimerization subunit type 1 TsaB [Comamonadaceae bacterium]|nr:MAG: tRNA (adenosine(37)-N6)-threonylcarbamoyltransferase complex dimerization subunit type 1 TsaB [Comamonadaceae bacterium]
MKLLAFDTSTEAMSIAVSDGGRMLEHTGAGGAQASATLIPAVMALLKEAGLSLAELDAIAFGRGPGSFTGLRTACSVAQGLAFGARVRVLPVDTLLALADDARLASGRLQIVAALDARMDEMYVARYDFAADGAVPDVEPLLVGPQALDLPAGWVLAGNVFTPYAARLQGIAAQDRVEALPTAAAMLRLAPALLAAGRAVDPAHALPRYIRDKVAKTTSERAAEKSAQPASPP